MSLGTSCVSSTETASLGEVSISQGAVLHAHPIFIFFEVLIIDRNWPIQINFILCFFPPSPLTISCWYLIMFVLHVTMSQMLQAIKKAAVGKWWLLVASVALPRSDVQE